MIKQYTKQKENLLAVYQMLEGLDSKFVDQNLKLELLEKKESLKKDKFILAVAGQMKAGKSTLLNALIFGDDVLPADDTELTAKTTFITYAEESSYEATLYSKNEFDELRNSMRNTESETEFNKSLNCSLENLQDRGYSSYEELLSKKVITGENLKDLIDFVGKNGVFTPFVNTLTLKTNSPWVKNIIVVDTPGMNSPNKLRDQVVKDWIINADAVLYCSFASRAMDATDLTFVRDYMMHISPKYRLFALTKSDLINGEDKLMNTIGDMIDSEWNQKSGLIPSRDTVFPVSQMAVLLDKMDKSKIPFTSRMDEEYEMLENKVNFDHCNRQFLNLERAIEKKLIANKDTNVIETHQQYLSTIFSEKLYKVKENIDNCKKTFELIDSDENALKEKQVQIQSDIKNIKVNFEAIETKIKNLYDATASMVEIEGEFNEVQKAISKKLENMPLTDLENHAARVVSEKFDTYIENLKKQSREFSSKFSRELGKFLDEYDLKMKYLNTEFIKEKIEFECTSFINLKLKELKRKINEASVNLKRNYSKNVSFFRGLRDFFRGTKKVDRERGKEAFNLFNSETLNPMFNYFAQMDINLKSDLNVSVQKIINQIRENADTKLDTKLNEIEELKKTSVKDIDERKQKSKLEYSSLEKEKQELENLIGNISEMIIVDAVLENSYL